MPFDVIDQDGTLVGREEEPTIRAIILYNAFDHSDRTVTDLVWGEDKTVAQYLDGLPEDQNWNVWVKTSLLPKEQWGDLVLRPNDQMVIGLIPSKSAGSIIGLVAMVALMVVAPEIGAALAPILGVSAGVIGGVVTAVGGLLITAAMTLFNSNKGSSPQNTSSAYGLDGPKNTNTEQIPVPIVYGTFRMAGNLVNQYIENNTDLLTQTLFQQYVISEGEISGISEVYLNDQLITGFPGCLYDWRAGVQTQAPMQWFSETIVPVNINAVITPTVINYTTSTAVDRIRLDVEFPQGLYSVDKTGNIQNASVLINCQYRPTGTLLPWQSFDQGLSWQVIDGSDGSTGGQSVYGIRLTVQVTGYDDQPYTPFALQAAVSDQYNGNSQLIASDEGFVQNNIVTDVNGNISYQAGTLLKVYEVNNLTYEPHHFLLNGGLFPSGACVVVKVEAYFETQLAYSNNTRTAIRSSITSPPLNRAQYDVQVVRPTMFSTSSNLVDTCSLIDVNEIRDDVINYANTAYLGVQVLIGEQINAAPKITSLVQGRLVNLYDRVGNISNYAWSNNPADVALDLLLNPSHRFAISSTRIDFASFDDWRSYCAAQNLLFNGVFDTLTNVWDALLSVMRIGRASPVLQGMRWAVMIEAPADAVMMFTQDNMIKDSFTIEWTGRSGRANLVEVQYFEMLDNYKQHSAFALDETFVVQGDALVQSTVQLVGCNNAQQAVNEASLLLNLNRYTTTSVSFDVPLQAMGCIVGDVIYVQHDMPAWGYSAMITSVDPAGNITIDSDIPWDGEPDWNLLLIRSTSICANGLVQSVSGSQVQIEQISPAGVQSQDSAYRAYAGSAPDSTLTYLANGTNITNELANGGISRVLIDGQDYEVVDVTVFPGNYIVVTTDRAVTANIGDVADLWKQDLLCESTIAPPDYGTHTITPTGWTNHAGNPQPGDRIMLGEISKYKKPFRITKIEIKQDNVRTIYALEYNETVYGPNAMPTPNYSALSTGPSQVINLTATQTVSTLQGGALQYYANFAWNRPLADPRGYISAQVYTSINYGAFTLAVNQPNPNSTFVIPANLNDTVRVKVVANYADGEIANYSQAPIAGLTIGAHGAKPVGLQNISCVGGIRSVTLTWDPVTDPYVSGVQIRTGANNTYNTSVVCFQGGGNSFTLNNMLPDYTAYFWLQTIAISGATGDVQGPFSATTSLILTSDLDAAIAATAAFAQTIVHPTVVAALPATANNGDMVLLTTDGRLYTYNSSTGTWTATIAVVSVDGKLTSDQIASINAAQIEGTLSADQIGSLEAASIAGQLTAAQIGSIASTSITGQLTASQIVSVNAAQINGQLSASQIASINAAQIAGQLTASQVASISSAQITGQITASQVASIVASQVTGQLAGTQIAAGAITANNIAANAIQAGAIQAGAITTAAIAAGAITTATLAANAVTAQNISAGAVTAQSLAAGAVTTNALAVGSATNNIWNPSCVDSTDGWTCSSYLNGTTVVGSTLSSGYSPWYPTDEGGGGYVNIASIAVGQIITAYWMPVTNNSIACAPGDWIEASAYVGAHRCAAFVYLQFLDTSGNLVNQIISPRSVVGAGPTLASYQRVGCWGQAGAGAVAARLVIVGSNDGGADFSNDGAGGNQTKANPYLWFCRGSIGSTVPNATQLQSYQPGGLTSITGGVIKTATIEARNMAVGSITAASIAAGAITAASIAAGAITTAALAAGAVTAGTIAAGAITTPAISAGAITAQQLAASSVTTSALTVGSSSNVCWNSCWESSSAGWIVSGATQFGPANASLFGAQWELSGYGSGGVLNSSVPSGSAITLEWSPNFSDKNVRGVAWPGSQKFECQAQLIPLNIAARVLVYCYDINNNVLATYAGNTIRPASGVSSGVVLSEYAQSFIIATPPAATNYIISYVQGINDGGSDINSSQSSFVFFTQFLIGATTAGATSPSVWSPGGVTTVSGDVVKTGTLNATKIVASSITTTQIAAGTITAENIAANTITGNLIQAATITSNNMQANSITAGIVAAGAIGADQIAANAIHAYMLASDFSLTDSAQIGTAVIGTAQIGNLVVGTEQLGASSATNFSTGFTGPTQTPNGYYSYVGATLVDGSSTGVILLINMGLNNIDETATSTGNGGNN